VLAVFNSFFLSATIRRHDFTFVLERLQHVGNISSLQGRLLDRCDLIADRLLHVNIDIVQVDAHIGM